VHGEPPHTPYPPMHPYHAVILSTSGETQTLEARGGSVTPGADASQRAARHFAGVKGARTAIYLATQEPTRCYISPSSAMDSAASRSTADDSRCLHAASSRWVEGDTGAGLMAATGFGEGEGDEWVSSTCDCTHAGMSGPCIGDKGVLTILALALAFLRAPPMLLPGTPTQGGLPALALRAPDELQTLSRARYVQCRHHTPLSAGYSQLYTAHTQPASQHQYCCSSCCSI
jgi:hypothetical protein